MYRNFGMNSQSFSAQIVGTGKVKVSVYEYLEFFGKNRHYLKFEIGKFSMFQFKQFNLEFNFLILIFKLYSIFKNLLTVQIKNFPS